MEVKTDEPPKPGDDNPAISRRLDSPLDAVEGALLSALEGAAAAGRFDVVAQLAKEIEARRLARAGVPTLEERRARR